MSRRRGEFEHRTSIFEGAFRAWSHLGGLTPSDLETKTAADLDPLSHPLTNDPRLTEGKKNKKKVSKGSDGDSDAGGEGGGGGDASGAEANGGPNLAATSSGVDQGQQGGGGGGSRQEYPYEPLPRQGLSHPFVQAILSPWLGPDADQDAIQLGLTTLRTWWQHRRKGESGSAIAALGTEKMRGVVEGYTRHFFNLAHCLVTNDGEQPPRTLMIKMKEIEKARNKKNKKRAREEEAGKLAALALNAAGQHGLAAVTGPGAVAAAAAAGCCDADGSNGAGGAAAAVHPGDDNLSPLERLHAAQRRQLAESGLGGANGGQPQAVDANGNPLPSINMKGQCIPGKLDLPGIVSQVSSHANQLAHRGALGGPSPAAVPSSWNGPGGGGGAMGMGGGVNSGYSDPNAAAQQGQYGDPTKTPVVFVSENGDIQIAMSVDGITCAHCVKIVETVLKGCNGNRSPIDGLLDAAADRALNSVLIKIDRSSNAKRIAFEAARNLAMVGYTAKAKEMSIAGGEGCGGGGKIDMGLISTAFSVVATTEKTDVFDWTLTCTCPDNGILREDCDRHSQMNKGIFAAFERREEAVTKYMAGCGQLHGMPCTCTKCKCASCDGSCQKNQQQQQQEAARRQQDPAQLMLHQIQQQQLALQMQQQRHPMAGGMGGAPNQALHSSLALQQPQQHQQGGVGGRPGQPAMPGMSNEHLTHFMDGSGAAEMPTRGSIGSWDARRTREMSLTSESGFGRAMSGLSALSIDWENMEDFDVNVDLSAHINNNGASPGKGPPVGMVTGGATDDADGIMEGCGMLKGGECNCGPACVCVGCPTHDQATALPNMAEAAGRRRSSLRRNDPSMAQNMQVSFKI